MMSCAYASASAARISCARSALIKRRPSSACEARHQLGNRLHQIDLHQAARRAQRHDRALVIEVPHNVAEARLVPDMSECNDRRDPLVEGNRMQRAVEAFLKADFARDPRQILRRAPSQRFVHLVPHLDESRSIPTAQFRHRSWGTRGLRHAQWRPPPRSKVPAKTNPRPNRLHCNLLTYLIDNEVLLSWRDRVSQRAFAAPEPVYSVATWQLNPTGKD